jgi:hypothetical protein
MRTSYADCIFGKAFYSVPLCIGTQAIIAHHCTGQKSNFHLGFSPFSKFSSLFSTFTSDRTQLDCWRMTPGLSNADIIYSRTSISCYVLPVRIVVSTKTRSQARRFVDEAHRVESKPESACCFDLIQFAVLPNLHASPTNSVSTLSINVVDTTKMRNVPCFLL